MQKFGLSSREALPEGSDGYPIHTDFRVILRIFRMLDDPEVLEEDKPLLLRRMFFADKAPADAERLFLRFVRMGRECEASSGEKDFDYEQDAAEIYSAFLQTYGIDLLSVEELHWWKFLAMLEGLFMGENALSNKVRLRHADDSDSVRKAALDRQKRMVQLREAVSRSDMALEKEIAERIDKGLPLGNLLRR